MRGRGVDSLQGFLFQFDISEIVSHEAYEPDSVIHLLYSEPLTGHEGRDVDFLSMHADAPACCDQHISIMHGIVDFWQAVVAAFCGSIDVARRLHFEGLVGSFIIELADKFVEAVLLLEGVFCGGPTGVLLQREMHAFMAAVLLRIARLNPLDGDAQAQPPDGQPVESSQLEHFPTKWTPVRRRKCDQTRS
ncbi:MAG: hypothetical protein H6875_04845 [Hyphomicrobiaceae bacterium]|nr:hypothetical protein [Hyphomicrobiaceae bacterium]